MLSHVKYRNSIYKRIKKKSKSYLGTPMLREKLPWIESVRKNIQCRILLCFGVYTPTQYALSCKIQKFKFYLMRKNLNIIEARQC